MKIKADADGRILAWGIEVPGEEYSGVLPGDFEATAGLGKHQFVGGAIEEVPEWSAPEAPAEPSLAAIEPELEVELEPQLEETVLAKVEPK